MKSILNNNQTAINLLIGGILVLAMLAFGYKHSLERQMNFDDGMPSIAKTRPFSN